MTLQLIVNSDKWTDKQKHNYLISKGWRKIPGGQYRYELQGKIECGIDQAVKTQVFNDRMERKCSG